MSGVEVKKSPNDKRSYKRLLLENGLQVLLMHDPYIDMQDREESEDEMSDSSESSSTIGSSKKAAAAMSVRVGAFSDPERLQGLSHYLEHMLFMGSKKYPTENEYDDYLGMHGGFSNAFTGLEFTTYYFSVNGNALHGTLDRFAQFFIDPLCLEDAMEREVLSVDSEHSVDVQNDSCRLVRVAFSTTKPDHIYDMFWAGNKKSLKDVPEAQGINVRSALLDHYRQNYSAERMCLTVLGGESLEELEKWVVDLFSGVNSGLGPAKSFGDAGHPFEGQFLCVLPSIKDMNALTVTFQLPSLISEYNKKPEHYISHLIGHEGPGSLLSALKKKGWVVGLSAGVPQSDVTHNSCVSMFEVAMTLTEKGLNAGPGFGLAAVELLFSYINMLRDSGPHKWIFDELKAVQDVKIRFLEDRDSGEFVQDVSLQMHQVKPGDEILADYLIEDWDPEQIKKLLSMMHPRSEGMRIDIQTSSFERLVGSLEDKKEKLFVSVEKKFDQWYEFDYVYCKFHPDLLESLSKPPVLSDLHLPPKNMYIPYDLSLCSEGDPTENQSQFIRPKVLVDRLGSSINPETVKRMFPGLRVWHKVDQLHKTPKACGFFYLSTRIVETNSLPRLTTQHTPKASAATALLVNILEDALTEECYMADVAGLTVSVRSELSGIQFSFSGFSDKFLSLVKEVFTRFAALKIDEQSFANMKEDTIRKMKNTNTKANKHCNYTRVYALIPSQWHVDQVVAEMENITISDIQDCHRLVLEDLYIEAFVYGNIKPENVLSICEEVGDIVGSSSMHSSQRRLPQCLKLESGKRVISLPTVLATEENSAVEVYIQCCPYNFEMSVRLDLVDQMICDQVFDVLRTKEQLGYLVWSRARLTQGILGFSCQVVSARYPPNYLDARIENFLKEFEKQLIEMSSEEFETYRQTLISCKMEKDKSLNETGHNIWDHIHNRRYNFDTKVREVQAIKDLSKKDLLDFYGEYLSPSSGSRRKLTVCIVCPGHEKLPESKEFPEEYITISSLDEFRAKAAVYPDPSGF